MMISEEIGLKEESWKMDGKWDEEEGSVQISGV